MVGEEPGVVDDDARLAGKAQEEVDLLWKEPGPFPTPGGEDADDVALDPEGGA